MQTVIPTIIRDLTYQAKVLANLNYLPSTRADVQEKYLKGNLAKIAGIYFRLFFLYSFWSIGRSDLVRFDPGTMLLVEVCDLKFKNNLDSV